MNNNTPRLYVAATRQNDGKTVTSLGLVSAFQQHFGNVGYTKPVGQRYVDVAGLRVDEDSLMIKQACGLSGDLQDMSPVAVPRGYTEAYINDPHAEDLEKRISESFARVSAGKDVVIVEGTGHAGVGSVIDMSNGKTAKLLGTPVLLVSSGGIGRPIDEIMLNKAMFDQHSVEILGVIVNKVTEEKFEKINRVVRKGLDRLGMRVFGVMPYDKVLASPTVEQLLHEVGGELLSGEKGLKATVNRMVIGAMPPHDALAYFDKGVLLITPGNREDLILAAMSSCVVGVGEESCVSGMILTTGIKPHGAVLRLIRRTRIPTILVEDETFELASKVAKLIVKVRSTDKEKIEAIKGLVAEHVDVQMLIDSIRERFPKGGTKAAS